MTELATERQDLERKMLRAMKAKGFSFRRLGAETDLSLFIVRAALLGQMSLSKEAAAKIATVLEIPEARDFLIQIPFSGTFGREIPTDPLIDRLYEIVRNYGTTIKALIKEEFGDGIMSATDFDLDLTRQPDPNGDRVKIVMTGKFLKSGRTGAAGATAVNAQGELDRCELFGCQCGHLEQDPGTFRGAVAWGGLALACPDQVP